MKGTARRRMLASLFFLNSLRRVPLCDNHSKTICHSLRLRIVMGIDQLKNCDENCFARSPSELGSLILRARTRYQLHLVPGFQNLINQWSHGSRKVLYSREGTSNLSLPSTGRQLSILPVEHTGRSTPPCFSKSFLAMSVIRAAHSFFLKPIRAGIIQIGFIVWLTSTE